MLKSFSRAHKGSIFDKELLQILAILSFNSLLPGVCGLTFTLTFYNLRISPTEQPIHDYTLPHRISTARLEMVDSRLVLSLIEPN